MLATLAQIYVGPDGVINVGGGGGRAGTTENSGGGGGSGGSLLLEAPLVTIVGTLAANGGGGGGSNSLEVNLEARHGDDGLGSAEHASGGNTGGEGGAGLSYEGQVGDTDSHWAGGGGGACGRIRINSNYPVQLEEGSDQATISPQLEDAQLFGPLHLAQ
jgi:hypothetical protein